MLVGFFVVSLLGAKGEPMDYCFYFDWEGLTPEQWAAWTQAVLSGLAICAAALFPSWQEKRTRKARIDVYVDILSRAESEAGHTHHVLSAMEGRPVLSDLVRDWSELQKVISGIPFHDVPDFRLYGLLLDASRACRDIHERLEEFPCVTAGTVMVVAEQQETLLGCYEEAIKISNQLAGKSWRYRLFKMKAWASRAPEEG